MDYIMLFMIKFKMHTVDAKKKAGDMTRLGAN